MRSFFARFTLSLVVIVVGFSLFAEKADAQFGISLRTYGAGFDGSPRALLHPMSNQVMVITPGYQVFTPGFNGGGLGGLGGGYSGGFGRHGRNRGFQSGYGSLKSYGHLRH